MNAMVIKHSCGYELRLSIVVYWSERERLVKFMVIISADLVVFEVFESFHNGWENTYIMAC